MNEQIIIISGPSGTGKNTIISALIDKGFPLEHSVSTTTRTPRSNEIHGKNYYFCDKNEFEEQINKNKFLEYALVLDTYYGTTKDEIHRIQSKGNIPILDIDIQGHKQIKEKYPEVLSIFVMPPSLRELQKRLINRKSESSEQIEKRLKLAEKEMQRKQDYDHIVVNKELEQAIKEVGDTISSVFNLN